MKISRANPMDAVGTPLILKSEYRVRAWNEPLDDISSWRVDEWDVIDAVDVSEVISWAGKLGAHSFEVFVRHEDHSLDSRGELVAFSRYLRVSGVPADDGGTSDFVFFTRE